MKLRDIATHADTNNPIMVTLLRHWFESHYGPVRGRILLALFSGRPIGRAELVRLVYGRNPPKTLDVSLRVAIYKLRERFQEEDEDYEIVVQRPNLTEGRKETVYQLLEMRMPHPDVA